MGGWGDRSGKRRLLTLTLLDLLNFVLHIIYSDKKNNNLREDCFWESTCGQKTPDWALLFPSCRPDSKPKAEGAPVTFTSFPTSDRSLRLAFMKDTFDGETQESGKWL